MAKMLAAAACHANAQPRRTAKPALLAALVVCTASACEQRAAHERALPSDQSPGPRTTAYLPPAPNNAATGSSTMNTANAVAGGQLSDWSNPTPPGLPAASGPLNGR